MSEQAQPTPLTPQEGGVPRRSETTTSQGSPESKPAKAVQASEQNIINLIGQGRNPDEVIQNMAADQGEQEGQEAQVNTATEQGERPENQEELWPGQEIIIKDGKPLPYHQITTPSGYWRDVKGQSWPDGNHSKSGDILIMNQQGEVIAYTYDSAMAEEGLIDEADYENGERPEVHLRDKIIEDIQQSLERRGLSRAYKVVVDDLTKEEEQDPDFERVYVDLKDLTGGKEANDPDYKSNDWMDLGSTYVAEQDGKLKQPHNQREEGIAELSSLLADPAYKERFTSVQTAAERAQVSAFITETTKAVEAGIKPYVEAAAADKLGVASVEERRKLGKPWGEALRAVTHIKTESGAEIPIEDVPAEAGREAQRGARSLIKDQLRPGFEAKMAQARQALKAAETKQKQALAQMQQELEARQTDPALLDAMDVWGRSPDARGNRGADGQGLHAGVIHYFEYRANQEKNGRYKESDPVPSIDGFIRYSAQLKGLLANPNPADNPAVQTARIIEDEQGQKRMYVLSKKGSKVVTFMRAGEPMRIITVIPGANEKIIQKDVDSELTADPNNPREQARLNHLGAGRKAVAFTT